MSPPAERYDSYNLLSKALLCPLSEGMRRIIGKEKRALSASTPLIAADGTNDDDQLPKESVRCGFGDVRIVTVKEEREMPGDCTLTRADDTVSSTKKIKLLDNNTGAVFTPF